ncbi:MAG: peptidoglycan bridge formation glycyltransferase FemA/FemB family protein [Patescibacteria group bacterium]|nr:peptidoglycan bridge formation glycyltransferase FemA/FemB family protein [Patescibacteria group bacterium]
MRICPQNSLTANSWDTALLAKPDANFLQSWAWGDFQTRLGNKVWRLAVEANGQIINQIQVIKLSLGFGWSVLYAPKGNLVNKALSASDQQASAKLLLQEIIQLGSHEKVVCFRIDPHIAVGDKIVASIYRSLGFQIGSKSVQPKHSLMLSINQNPATLLQRMKPKTRYNIRLAEKKGIKVKLATELDDIKHFIRLTHQTADRDRFKAHSDNYYATQFRCLAPQGMQDLFLAYLGPDPIAGILINKFGQTATYVHGASGNDFRNLMAPHLLQFSAIKKYHEDGFKEYDFWGISPYPHHPWAGLTRFKEGFGGQKTEYIGTLELPLHPLMYRFYTLINRLR